MAEADDLQQALLLLVSFAQTYLFFDDWESAYPGCFFPGCFPELKRGKTPGVANCFDYHDPDHDRLFRLLKKHGLATEIAPHFWEVGP